MRKSKKLLSLLLAVCLIFGLLPVSALAAEGGDRVSDLKGTTSYNKNGANYQYSQWATPAESYLYMEGDTPVRVEYIGKQLVIEYFSANYDVLDRKTITFDSQYTEWGGVYFGESYNYVFVGQQNYEEDKSKEVIHVIQYDKDWNELGTTGVHGSNTVCAFDGGTLRCAEYGDMLYVFTCHEMYAIAGINHQANMTFAVSQSELEVTDVQCQISFGYAYVSHSFNQFVLVDEEGRIVTLDHGDGYPRGIVLHRYQQAAGSKSFGGSAKEITFQTFPGEIGDNATGAAVGGFVETSSGYLTLYSYDGEGGQVSDSAHNVYLAYTPKDAFSSKETSIHKLTAYSSEKRLGTPVIVPTGLDGGYLLWNDPLEDGIVCYTTYDAEGNTGEIQSAEGALSDCQPVVWGDKIIWYVTTNGSPTFYTLDESGLQAETSLVDINPDDIYYDAVLWAVAEGVTTGTSETAFSPAASVTREQAVTFLWRAAGSPDPDSMKSPFTDVTDSSAYYYKAVLWAAEQGITTGIGNDRFGVGGTLAYDQIFAMLARTAGKTVSGSDWSNAALQWAENLGLTDGLNVSAKANCPRSDVVYCLWKQLG